MRVVREPMKQSTSVGPGDFFQCSRACLCTKQEMASCIFNAAFAGQTEAVAGALSTFLPVAASWRKCGLHSARNVPARPLRPRNCNNRINVILFYVGFGGLGSQLSYGMFGMWPLVRPWPLRYFAFGRKEVVSQYLLPRPLGGSRKQLSDPRDYPIVV